MEIKINNKTIKNFSKPFIIAEVGANFNGNIDTAKQMISAAKKAGADAVKFQAGNKDNMLSESLWKDKPSPLPIFGHKTQAELEDFLSLSFNDHKELYEHSKKEGIEFSSTVFSFDYVDFLDDLGVNFFKIASMDLNHTKLIEQVAKKNKPTFLSTGLGNLNEINSAVEIFKKNGNNQLILFHCVSLYPPESKEVNLNNIRFLSEKFNLNVGFSDHTLGTDISIASFALGACALEKHFTLDKKLPGWDHSISADPDDLKLICQSSNTITDALGSAERSLSEREKNNINNLRISITAAKNIKKGTILTEEILDYKRPGTGIAPNNFDKVIGKKIMKDLEYDEQIKFEFIE